MIPLLRITHCVTTRFHLARRARGSLSLISLSSLSHLSLPRESRSTTPRENESFEVSCNRRSNCSATLAGNRFPGARVQGRASTARNVIIGTLLSGTRAPLIKTINVIRARGPRRARGQTGLRKCVFNGAAAPLSSASREKRFVARKYFRGEQIKLRACVSFMTRVAKKKSEACVTRRNLNSISLRAS